MMLSFDHCVKWACAGCLVQYSMSGMDALQPPTQIHMGTRETAVLFSADLILLSRQIVVQTSQRRWPLLHCSWLSMNM